MSKELLLTKAEREFLLTLRKADMGDSIVLNSKGILEFKSFFDEKISFEEMTDLALRFHQDEGSQRSFHKIFGYSRTPSEVQTEQFAQGNLVEIVRIWTLMVQPGNDLLNFDVGRLPIKPEDTTDNNPAVETLMRACKLAYFVMIVKGLYNQDNLPLQVSGTYSSRIFYPLQVPVVVYLDDTVLCCIED